MTTNAAKANEACFTALAYTTIVPVLLFSVLTFKTHVSIHAMQTIEEFMTANAGPALSLLWPRSWGADQLFTKRSSENMTLTRWLSSVQARMRRLLSNVSAGPASSLLRWGSVIRGCGVTLPSPWIDRRFTLTWLSSSVPVQAR